jgi:hypothetical protein
LLHVVHVSFIAIAVSFIVIAVPLTVCTVPGTPICALHLRLRLQIQSAQKITVLYPCFAPARVDGLTSKDQARTVSLCPGPWPCTWWGGWTLASREESRNLKGWRSALSGSESRVAMLVDQRKKCLPVPSKSNIIPPCSELPCRRRNPHVSTLYGRFTACQ